MPRTPSSPPDHPPPEMPNTKRSFNASLIKYRDPESEQYVWFWVNSSSGGTISPSFNSRKDAEKWYDNILRIHFETIDLILRAKDGQFYKLRGRVDVEEMLMYTKNNKCPFRVFLEEDVITVDILARSEQEAKQRLLEYFEILEWL